MNSLSTFDKNTEGLKAGKKYVNLYYSSGMNTAKEYLESIGTFFDDEVFLKRFEYASSNQFLTRLFNIYNCDVCSENFYDYILEELQMSAQNDGVAEWELYEQEGNTTYTFEDFFEKYNCLSLILNRENFEEVKDNLKAWYDYGYISEEGFNIVE